MTLSFRLWLWLNDRNANDVIAGDEPPGAGTCLGMYFVDRFAKSAICLSRPMMTVAATPKLGYLQRS